MFKAENESTYASVVFVRATKRFI